MDQIRGTHGATVQASILKHRIGTASSAKFTQVARARQVAGRPDSIRRRSQLPAAIAGRHGLMPSRPEIERFVDRLIEFRLLVPREQADSAVEFTLQGAPAPWRAPEIAVYGDMRELLAMDPPLPLAKPARS